MKQSLLGEIQGLPAAKRLATERVPLPPAPLTEPMLYLSTAQQRVLEQRFALGVLSGYAPPCWVPQRLVADALGHGQTGIQHALAHTGRPYLWATEFENVHSLWRYSEPVIVVDGIHAPCSEAYYHSQKPKPFDEAVWDARREAVMEAAVRAKLTADPSLEELLRATGDHPLLSIKADQVWGFHPHEGGRNLLAKIWERIRAELKQT